MTRSAMTIAPIVGSSQECGDLTQLLSLTLLAPDIQEEILFLEVEGGVERITQRALRDVVKVDNWDEQRRRWHVLRTR
jgi:hypothetical protein